jgi:hypothetical protein
VRIRSKILIGLLTGVSATVLSIAGAGAATTAHAAQADTAAVKPFAGVFNPIKNSNNDLCLQAVAPAPGTAVVQEPCISDPNDPNAQLQGWQAISIGGRTGFLNQSGYCLFAFVGAKNGAPLGLNTCRTVSNEEFDTSAPLPNVVTIESRIGFVDTGFCIFGPGTSTTPGQQIVLESCDSSVLAQHWSVGFPLS